MIQVHWTKLTSGNWCKLHTVDLQNVTTGGVYVIWHSGNPSRVVYVGQGDVKSRLESHRMNDKICAYASHGELFVTWASVPAAQRDGVERYLADTWNPQVGDAYPQAAPIAVNSPW